MVTLNVVPIATDPTQFPVGRPFGPVDSLELHPTVTADISKNAISRRDLPTGLFIPVN
jgi:hypothetical protein